MDTLPIPPSRHAWLLEELPAWRAAGLVSDEAAAAIAGRYHASRRFSLARLLLVLGGLFVAVGLIWLVAANIDALPPTARFALVAGLWVAVVVGTEVGHVRRRAAGRTGPSPLVEVGRLVGAVAYGAVVFQAAQSLQVPAYESSLVGVWALGALVLAYALRSPLPLFVAVVAGLVWLLWATLERSASGLGAIVVLAAAAALCVGAATLHDRPALHDRLPGFAALWRDAGALLLLATLFGAAVPFVEADGFAWRPSAVAAVVAAALVTAAAVVLGRGEDRLEPVVSVLTGLVSAGLVLWEPSAGLADGGGDVALGDWAQSALSVLVYVALATAVAVVGIRRDAGRLTFLALAALTLFTVFQSFAVFAPIVDGAWLFLLLGLVLVGTGWLADRGRRRLEASLDDGPGSGGAPPPPPPTGAAPAAPAPAGTGAGR